MTFNNELVWIIIIIIIIVVINSDNHRVVWKLDKGTSHTDLIQIKLVWPQEDDSLHDVVSSRGREAHAVPYASVVSRNSEWKQRLVALRLRKLAGSEMSFSARLPFPGCVATSRRRNGRRRRAQTVHSSSDVRPRGDDQDDDDRSCRWASVSCSSARFPSFLVYFVLACGALWISIGVFLQVYCWFFLDFAVGLVLAWSVDIVALLVPAGVAVYLEWRWWRDMPMALLKGASLTITSVIVLKGAFSLLS